jgi:uncharacterized protein YbjT (DUF2867 family)
MVMNVLVTGGTGALGRELVLALRSSGHRARVLSRRPGTGADWVQGDLASGQGLDRAVADMDAIVHAGSAAARPWRLRAPDVEGTRRLLETARRADVRHLAYVSIVGIDGVAYPYYRYKLAAESVVGKGIVPWSILRATQFHGFIETILGVFSRLPRVTSIPFDWRFQPVDTGEVAARLVEAVNAGPAGSLPDFGGPEVRTLRSLAESWLKARRRANRLVNLRLPIKFSRQVTAGGLLCTDHQSGSTTFDQYLAGRYGKW